MFENSECILYADDTCIVYTGSELSSLCTYVNEKLSIIENWCNKNKLSLNTCKCEYMVVTTKNTCNEPLLFIGGNQIRKVEFCKYLGIYIDRNLRFNVQIKQIKIKLSRLCGVAFRLSDLLNFKTARNFYYSCVYSVLSYCIAVWGGVLECTHRADCLISLHARIIKLLFSKYYPDGSCPFKNGKILKLGDIYRLNVSIYMFKVVKLNSCHILRNNLDLTWPEHSYSTRNLNLLIPSFPRVEAIRYNFKHQFIKVWNDVPLEIKNENTFRSFKNKLRDHFLNSY